MLSFRAFAYDINSNDLITELPTKGLEFEQRLNEAGAYKSTLPLAGSKQETDLAATILGLGQNPFKVLVTDAVWQRAFYSGIAWAGELSSENTDLDITGKGLTSYFQQVGNWVNYTSAIQPAQLVQKVVQDVQSRTGANRGLATRLQVSNSAASITPNYLISNHTTPAQILADQTAGLTPGTGGVDYYVEDMIDRNGVPRHTMVICAPRAGRTSANSGLGFILSAAQKWKWPYSNLTAGNHVVAVGSTAGGTAPTGEAWAPFAVGGKGQPPLLEQIVQFSQVTNSGQLTNLANGLLNMFQRPVAAPTVTFPVDYEPMPLGSFNVGDDVLVTTEPEPRFPQGLSEWWRIVAYKVATSEDGNYTYTLTLNRPPVF